MSSPVYSVIGATVFASFVLGALTTEAILRPRQDHEHAHDRDYAQYPAAQNSDQVTAVIAIAEEIQSARKDTYSSEADKRWRDIVTITGILIYTAITAVIAGYAVYQAHIFRSQERRQLRAYVGPVFSSFVLTNRLVDCDPGANPRIMSADMVACFRMKNYGTTPARMTNYCGGVFAIDGTLQQTIDKQKGWCIQHAGKYHTTVWPGEKL